MDPVRTGSESASLIRGVALKELVTHPDDRGFFREILRVTDDFFQENFGQWSHCLMFDGVIKAWHLHKVRAEYFYVVSGVMRVGLCDLRPQSETYKKAMDFLMGDQQPPMVLKIPPGVAHGVKSVQGPVNLLYLASHVYDPEDELRIPYDDPGIDFDWLSGPRIR